MGSVTVVFTSIVQRVGGLAAWGAWRLRRRLKSEDSIDRNKGLHIGSGGHPVKGWINLDYSIHVLISRIPLLPSLLYKSDPADGNGHAKRDWLNVQFWDLSYPLPFPKSTFDFIYSSHVLEHLPLTQAELLLNECYRVLKEGGKLRMVVPDMYMAASQYVSGVVQQETVASGDAEKVAFLGQYINRNEVSDAFVSEFFEGNKLRQLVFGHAWMYDFWSLKRRLERIGFSCVMKWDFQKGTIPDLEFLDRRPDNSLHIECVKLTSQRNL
jgi:SAM-dependent methyltransferase